MRKHQNDDREWEKAYELFRNKAKWTKIPSDLFSEEQMAILGQQIEDRIKKDA